MGLIDDIAEIIGQQFVSQTRFDPQRRAETEQALYEQIPGLLNALATQGEVSCAVEGHTARISADTLRTVGQRFSMALAPLIPDDISLIAFDSLLSSLPGLALASQQGQPLRTQAVLPSAVVAGAAQLATNTGELVFQRQIACASASHLATPAPQAVTAAPAPTVSHYVIAGHAAALSPGIAIAPGVSVTGSNQVTVASSAEAQLNGQAIDGSVTLAAGDRLTAGGIEVLFITVES